ncbi:MAG: hypothetical protein M1833_000468 [Piccolia ochrophora]|nr:MAG: hypothetical protein M1833_000468 [Piccolia ochrophora]
MAHGQRQMVPELPRNPSNSMTKLVSALVNKIDPTADIRYQLVWNFGGYLADIPRRLGTNPVLDAASDALVSAHTNYCSSGHPRAGCELLAKYSHALNVLRDALDDPVKAHSSETLCAIMLLMIVQVLTNPSKGFAASHGEGATQILKSRGSSGPCDEFEKKLLLTLRGPVVFEALLNDNIRFSQREWKHLVESGLKSDNIEADWFRYLARLPDLMHRCRRALYHPHMILDTSLSDLVFETESLLEDCKLNITALRDRLRTFEEDPPPSAFKTLLHAHRVRILALALFTGILFSCVLSSLSGKPLRLCTETSQWSHEIYHLARVAVKYRPLGSMAMIVCLYVAWIGAASEDLREKIKTLLADYEKTCLGQISGTELTMNLVQTEKRFTMQEPWLAQGALHVFGA